MNVNVDSEQTILLILPEENDLYPLSSAALSRAQASKRELENSYKNALILSRDGILRKIEHIELIRPWGESIGRKLLSRLTGAWHIQSQLSEPLPWNLEDLKQLIAECINSHGYKNFPRLENPSSRERVLAAVFNSSTVAHIFEALDMPPPEDALDVL